MTELLYPKEVAIPPLFCQLFRLSLAHVVAHQKVNCYIFLSDFTIDIKLLVLRALDDTSCAPLSWPGCDNAYSNVCRHCSGAIYAYSGTSIDVRGSTYFNANNAGSDGGDLLSEENVRSGVTSNSVSDFRFILVIQYFGPTIHDAGRSSIPILLSRRGRINWACKINVL